MPLPPNVDASDLFNTRPADGAVADATPYYKKDDEKVTTATAAAPSDRQSAARARQAMAGEKVTSEAKVAAYRAAEERQQKQKVQDAELKLKLAELEARWLYSKSLKADDPEGEAFLLEGKRSYSPLFRDLAREQLAAVADTDEFNEVYSEAELKLDRERLKLDWERVLAEKAAADAKPGARYNILVLSGGGSHGAYSAGVMCGWSDAGCRPKFDVVTGVSTGALVAAVTFLGPDYDCILRRFYTTTRQKMLRGDIWKVKAVPPLGLGTDSLASNAPLRAILGEVMDSPGYFEKVAAEHAAGRRLYIGTTNLDTQRFVVWDMGAIASEGTPESRKLYKDIVAASAAIPPLITPSRITTNVDGQTYEEMHVDGGVTRNLFFYPPSDWPGDVEDEKTGYRMLAGANVYVVVAGRIYNDPEGTNPKVLGVGIRTLNTLMSSLQRAELTRVAAKCERHKMAFNLAAIPADYTPLYPPTQFDPEKMTALFLEGYNRVREGRVWNQESPEEAVSEDRARRSTDLTSTPSNEVGPLSPIRPGPGVRTFLR